jgi:hypothetical protein
MVAANQWLMVRTTIDDLTIGADQSHAQHMVAERALPMVVLAVNIIGNCPTNGDDLGSWRDRQHPSTGQHDLLDIT